MTKTIFQVSALTMVLFTLFFACMDVQPEDSEENKDTDTYSIGDTGPSGIGKVFHVTDGGLHGFEAAPNDQSASAQWSNIFDISIGNTNTSVGTGMANSNDIVSQVSHASSAAQFCRDYSGGGMTDWFLPSKDELNLLYLQRAAAGVFTATFYWSSSEVDEFTSWCQNFDSGTQSGNFKDSTFYVRAVRAF